MRNFKGHSTLAVFPGMNQLLSAIGDLKKEGWENFLVYSPVPHHDIEHLLHRAKSPVRVFTLVGCLTGFCTGWALTIGSVLHYPLIVGGKPLLSIPPFGVLAYILTILFGALATVIGFLINARLPQLRLAASYDERLSSDHFGIQIFCPENDMNHFEETMKLHGAVFCRRDVQGDMSTSSAEKAVG